MQSGDEHPLLIPVAGLTFGVSIALLLGVTAPWWPLLSLLVLLAITARAGSVWLFRLVLASFFVCWGLASMAPLINASEHPSPLGMPPLIGNLVVEGVVAQRPVALPQGERFELQVERVITPQGVAPVRGRLLVTVAAGQGDWLTGDLIRIVGSLRQPRRLGLPDEFNYPRYLALQGVDATLWVRNRDQVALLRAADRYPWLRLLDQAALRCNAAIRQAVPDPDAAAVVMALVTGSQAAIPPLLTAAYARAGVSHILSISGFHVAIIAAALTQLLLVVLLRWEWLALRWNLRRGVLLFILPFMALYLLFTGAAPATARSVLMLAAVVVAFWAEREGEALDALLLSALLLIVHNPVVLFDLSFQLSFLSLWGIVVLTPLLFVPFEQRLSGWRRNAALFAAASFAAVLATAVPTLLTFHQASLTGILANLVVVPLLGYGATLVGCVAAPLVAAAPPLAHALFVVAGWLARAADAFIIKIAALPVLRSYQVGRFDLLLALALLSIVSFVSSRPWRWRLTGMLALVGLFWHLWPAPGTDGRLRMTFLSVGQGDATLIRFPDRTTMLVDGGGYLRDNGRDFGDRYLVPALHALQVERIDYLVLTHPHPDHLGGLPAVAEQFPVGAFWHGPWQGELWGEYRRLRSALQQHQVPVRQFQGGMQLLAVGNSRVTVFSPSSGRGQGVPTEAGNEASLVLRLDFGRFSALLMGDAGLQREEQLQQQGVAPVTVLKVGHHGSRGATGAPFLRQITPRLAVISVGADNRFGLPASATLQRLRECGTQICRTDRDGTIQVESDGVGYWPTTGLADR